MNEEIIEFKSSREYFYDEQEGIKNNTAREIDILDKRFQDLIRFWKNRDYPLIRIVHADFTSDPLATPVNPNKQHSFVRRVRHIAIYKELMIITWKV